MSLNLFDLTGRIAIITGTGRGIGRELALGFAAAGAIVVGCARTPESAQKTAAEIMAEGKEAGGCQCDVTVLAEVEALVDDTVRRYGKLDIMVCNAGINIRKPAMDFTPAEFAAVMTGNLTAYFLCAQAAARQFKAQGSGGAIVMTSSNASVAAFEGLAPYCAAKGGIDMLVRALAAEWGPFGIRVNAFNPGYTTHSMTPDGQAYLAEAENEIAARTPLRRMARTSEMVGPAIFLASDAASFITGTVVLVDGGWCAL